jgi:Mrp family chromosome partitioning ATPase/capsular polysaccharide biosynthesis protein
MTPATDTAAGRTDLRETLRPILTRWPIVLGLALLIGAFAYYQEQKKEISYVAETQMLLQPGASAEGLGLGSGGGADNADRVAATQAILLETRGVAKLVARKLGYKGPPEDLLAAVSVVPSEESSDFITIAANAGNPVTAAAIANGFAEAFVDSRGRQARAQARLAERNARRELAQLQSQDANPVQRQELQRRIAQFEVLQSYPVKDVKQVERAVPPTVGVGPRPVRNALFGLVLGLVLGAGIAYLLELLDRRVRRSTEVESLYDSPVLVEVPYLRKPLASIDGEAAVPDDMKESFRTLRTVLQLEHGSPRSIVVVSALPGEGKSTIVRNLAISYREEGLSVAAVDADLRAPDLARLFTAEGEPGLMNVLTGAVDLDEALQAVQVQAEGLDTMARLRHLTKPEPSPPAYDEQGEAPQLGLGILRRHWPGAQEAAPVGQRPHPNGNGHLVEAPGGVSLLAAGARPMNPVSVLASRRFRTVLDEITSRHDMTLIDSAPVLSVSDAVPLLSAVDGVIIATRLSLTTQAAARQLAEAIRRVPGVNVLGVVANAGDEPRGYYPAGGYPRRRKLPLPIG